MSHYLPDMAKAIIRTFGEKYPELRKGNDEQRRAFTMKVAQQLRFTLGETYGTKRADSGRPLSKDAIACRPSIDQLWSWDIINGTTREVVTESAAEDIAGQVFVPVDPVDHLHGGVVTPPVTNTDPPPPPSPPAAPSAFELDVRAAIGRIELRQDRIEARLALLQEEHIPMPPPVQPLVQFPAYRGTISVPFLGERSIRMEPEQ